MGAAAGKQFQSEKAKHAEAVLNAVQVFEDANEQDEDSYRGSLSTEFFKKKVRLAASDAKSKGKDIDKSLAQLTDADLDMLAHYAENRKDEERRQAGATSSSMHVEEIVDDEELINDKGGDNIDETTSVLSYGDDEEEAADHDDLDSSDEIVENIEEPAETRPRLNSGYKVFPMDVKAAEEDTNNKPKAAIASKTPDKTKLKLDEATVRPGIADHFAKFWDYEEVGSAPTHAAGSDSPLTAAHSGVNTPNKKFQSPKPAFPYKDRGQRIDERNEALMVLQRQKVISLTQNAQLEREVEALQRQLEKMDQIEQTFETSRLGRSGQSSLSNTATSTHSYNSNNNSAQLYPYGNTDFMSSSGHHGQSGNVHGKYSYIYPIDEEISQSTDYAEIAGGKSSLHSHYTNNLNSAHKRSDAKGTVVTGGAASVAHSRRVRKDRSAKNSSPSSSDNDSINSYNKNSGLSSKAQGKYGNAVVRVRSNDPSDLSDEFTHSGSAAPVIGKVGKTNSITHNNGANNSNSSASAGYSNYGYSNGSSGKMNPDSTNTTAGNAKGARRARAVAPDGDSDDSNHRHSGHAGYNPSSHTAVRSGAGRPANSTNTSGAHSEDHKHSDSDAETSLRSNKAQPLKIQSRRIVGVSVKPTINTATDEPNSKRLSDSDTQEAKDTSHHSNGRAGGGGGGSTAVATGLSNHGTSPKVSRARQMQIMQQNAAANNNNSNIVFDDAKQSSPSRVHREDHQGLGHGLYVHSSHSVQPSPIGSVVTDPSDKKYRALMDNVSLHLEAAHKDAADASTTASNSNGSNSGVGNVVLTASKLPVRNTKGGALKKLNKRRHSMDGLNEDPDTSQDEKGFKQYRHAASHLADGTSSTDKSPTHVGGVAVGALGREGSALGRDLGRDLVTTDDESVGQSPNRSKIRRPRAKLQVQGSLGPSKILGSVEGTNTTNTSVSDAQGDSYQPSTHITSNDTSSHHTRDLPSLTPDRHKPTTHATPTQSTNTTQATSTPTEVVQSEGEGSITNTTSATGSNTKPKRRSRAAAKQKSEANINSVNANSGGTNSTQAASAGPWDSTLDQWWAEISLLLRKPILQEEDMLYTVAAAEAGLMYAEEMNSIAKTLNVLRGALSRWILPYDNNTRIDSQCSTPHSVVENMPEEFRGKLTERQVHYLVAGANGVRKLVRVKIADDNDLEQARKALKSTDMFFKALYHRANEAGLTPYNLLLLAEKFSYA